MYEKKCADLVTFNFDLSTSKLVSELHDICATFYVNFRFSIFVLELWVCRHETDRQTDAIYVLCFYIGMVFVTLIFNVHVQYRSVHLVLRYILPDRIGSSHSYYGRRTGNRTQSFKWYQFQ